MRRRKRNALGAAALLALVLLGGCGGKYAVRGKVVEGSFAMVQFVDPDHELLASPGVAYADISILRDPTKPNQRVVASGRSNGQGQFDIPISEFGAGWMVEQWLVQVVKPGYETAETMTTLPGSRSGKRLLIVLAPGLSLPPTQRRQDLWEEAERYR